MAGFSVAELLERHSGEELELHARVVNPQFVRVLRDDRLRPRAGRAPRARISTTPTATAILDMARRLRDVQRRPQQPAGPKAALREALELDTARDRSQLGRQSAAGRSSPRSCCGERPRGSGACSSRTRAPRPSRPQSSSATLQLTELQCCPRSTASTASRSARSPRAAAASSQDKVVHLIPGFARVPFGDLDALERELLAEDVALFLIEPVQGKGVNLPPPAYLEGAQRLCRRYRDALLRRRGANGLRADRDHIRVRALGARA